MIGFSVYRRSIESPHRWWEQPIPTLAMNIMNSGRERRLENSLRFVLNAPADQLYFLSDEEYQVLYMKLDMTVKDYLNAVMPRKNFVDARATGPVKKATEPVLAAPDLDFSVLFDLDEDPVDPSDPVLKALIENYDRAHPVDLGRPFDGVDTSIPK